MIQINGNIDYMVGKEELKQNLNKLLFLNGWFFFIVIFKAVHFSNLK